MDLQVVSILSCEMRRVGKRGTRGVEREKEGPQSRKVNDTFIMNASGRSQVSCTSDRHAVGNNEKVSREAD